ncbi:hypothetical protein [Xenorhabdus bovienii]|uniref:hypothetical protein n=1 Tax=Xenorhabdus bovienii TaxID=40576 RepID=UPI0004D6A3B9|nr:hypothetical protein [Xenorhabdus bovienii]CDG86902.1 conserved hypothetical protein [Xenorhabdus bovienii str. feltiae France]CDG93279.1 conserved hypothetical protein [Xenorhabdus bovienii str. feltiae Florida]
MTQSTPTHTFTIDIKCDTEALNQLESQLEHIAELTDRINGRRYDAGMTLSVDTGVKAGITSDGFKAFDLAGKVFVKGTVDAKAIRASHDDHIRQIVREEIRQFVTRESGRGGLFSKW